MAAIVVLSMGVAFVTPVAAQSAAEGDGIDVVDFDAQTPTDVTTGESDTQTQTIIDSETSGVLVDTDSSGDNVEVDVQVDALGDKSNVDLGSGESAVSVKISGGTVASAASLSGNTISFTVDPGDGSNPGFTVDSLTLESVDTSSSSATASGLSYRLIAFQGVTGAGQDSGTFALESTVDSVGQAGPNNVVVEQSGVSQEIVPNSINIEGRSSDQIDIQIDISSLTGAGASVTDVSATASTGSVSSASLGANGDTVEITANPDTSGTLTLDSVELTGIDTSGMSTGTSTYNVAAEQTVKNPGFDDGFSADTSTSTANFDLIAAGVTSVGQMSPNDVPLQDSGTQSQELVPNSMTVETEGTQDTTVTVDISSLTSQNGVSLSNPSASVTIDDGSGETSATTTNVDASNDEITFTTGALDSANFDITSLTLSGIDTTSALTTPEGLTYDISASQETVSASQTTSGFDLTSDVTSIGQASPANLPDSATGVSQEVVPGSITIAANANEQVTVAVDISSLTSTSDGAVTDAEVTVNDGSASDPTVSSGTVEFTVDGFSGGSFDISSLTLTGVDTPASSGGSLSYTVKAEQTDDGDSATWDVEQATNTFDVVDSGVTDVTQASPNDVPLQSSGTQSQELVPNSVTVTAGGTEDTSVTVDVSSLADVSGVDLSGASVGTVTVSEGSVNSQNFDGSTNELTFTVTGLSSANFDITSLTLSGIDTTGASTTPEGLTYDISASQLGQSATQTTSEFGLTASVTSVGTASPADVGNVADTSSTVSQTVIDPAGSSVTIQGTAGEQIDVRVDTSSLGVDIGSATVDTASSGAPTATVDNTNNYIEFSVTPQSGESVEITELVLNDIDVSTLSAGTDNAYTIAAEQTGDGDFSSFSADTSTSTDTFAVISSGVDSVGTASPDNIVVGQTDVTQTIASGVTVSTGDTADTAVTVDVSSLANKAGVDLSGASVGTVTVSEGSVNSQNFDSSTNELTFTVTGLSNANFDITSLTLSGIDVSSASSTTSLDYDITATQSDVVTTQTTNTFALQDPAASSLSNLDIATQGTDATVTEETTGDISVDVENTGDVSGTFTLELSTDGGSTVATTTDSNSINSGSTSKVTFSDPVSSLSAGTYDIQVKSQDTGSSVSGTLTVVGGVDSVDTVTVNENFAGTIEDPSGISVDVSGIQDTNGNALPSGTSVTVDVVRSGNTLASTSATLDANGEITDATIDTTTIDETTYGTGTATVTVSAANTVTTTDSVDLVHIVKEPGTGYQLMGTTMPANNVYTQNADGSETDITTWDASANEGAGGYVSASATEAGAGYYVEADRVGFDLVEDNGLAQLSTDSLQQGYNIVGPGFDINSDANVEVGNDLQPTDISQPGIIAYTEGATGLSQASSTTTMGQFEGYIVYVDGTGEERSIAIYGFDPSKGIAQQS